MELLAEYKGDCDGLFLKLDKDGQESIPYDEKDQGYKAYWGTDESSDDDDDDATDTNNINGALVHYTETRYATDVNAAYSRSKSVILDGQEPPVFAWIDSFTTEWGNSGTSLMFASGPSPSGTSLTTIDQEDGVYSGASVSYLYSDGSSSPPKDTGNPNDPPKPKVIVKRLKEDKTEETIATIPRPAKPTEAVFICEDCEINCILLIRKKTDKFAVGICICNKEEDWILTKAQVKAELLKELPPIIQARLKAQEIPTVKTEVKTELREAFSTDISGAAANIKSELKADDEFKGSLIETVKQGLEEDIEFRTYITSTIYEALRLPAWKENFMSEIKTELLSDLEFLGSITERTKSQIQLAEFKTPYFEFLDGNKIADIIIASLADATKLASLKTKLGITATDPNKPPNPADSNKLTANGYEWQIGKDMAGVEIASVYRTALTGDNLSTLANSGSAIVTALLQKFPGKNFSVTSSSQMMGSYSYSIDQY